MVHSIPAKNNRPFYLILNVKTLTPFFKGISAILTFFSYVFMVPVDRTPFHTHNYFQRTVIHILLS